VANLQFYHDQEEGPKFGARGLAILRAVYPSFAAGCRSWVALREFSRQLANVMDSMPVGVIFARLDGPIVHENVNVRRILASVAPDNSLMCAITECIDRFRRVWSDRAPVMTSAPPRPTASDHRISGHTYRLSVSFLGGDLLPGGGAIVVVVDPIGPPPFPGGLLRDRYNLTAREIEVARLLAQGKTNLEVAAVLGVSAPTARHHTESVMLKLGVNARGKVAAMLGALTSGE
jgi:DNA-binding CsgD family transcriptional regulator